FTFRVPFYALKSYNRKERAERIPHGTQDCGRNWETTFRKMEGAFPPALFTCAIKNAILADDAATYRDGSIAGSITRIDFHLPVRKRRKKQIAIAKMCAVANHHAQ